MRPHNVRQLFMFVPGVEAGLIEWKGRTPQWTLQNRGDDLTFSVENGTWIARDAEGNPVEPE